MTMSQVDGRGRAVVHRFLRRLVRQHRDARRRDRPRRSPPASVRYRTGASAARPRSARGRSSSLPPRPPATREKSALPAPARRSLPRGLSSPFLRHFLDHRPRTRDGNLPDRSVDVQLPATPGQTTGGGPGARRPSGRRRLPLGPLEGTALQLRALADVPMAARAWSRLKACSGGTRRSWRPPPLCSDLSHCFCLAKFSQLNLAECRPVTRGCPRPDRMPISAYRQKSAMDRSPRLRASGEMSKFLCSASELILGEQASY